MRSARLVLALSTFAVIALAATPARADWVWVNRWPEPYSRPHFYLGAEGVGVFVLNESGPRAFLNHGGGFDLFLGGRLTRVFALELGWQPTFHNNEVNIFGQRVGTIGLEALTLDGKFYPWRGPVQPYFTIGVGGYLLGDNFSVFAEGPGWQIGGGIDFWLGRHLSIGAKVQYRGVEMFDYDANRDNTYLSLLTAGVNLTGRF